MTDKDKDAALKQRLEELNINWDDVEVMLFYGPGRWFTGPRKKDFGIQSGEEILQGYALGCAEAEAWNTKGWADLLARLDGTPLGPSSEQNHSK